MIRGTTGGDKRIDWRSPMGRSRFFAMAVLAALAFATIVPRSAKAETLEAYVLFEIIDERRTELEDVSLSNCKQMYLVSGPAYWRHSLFHIRCDAGGGEEAAMYMNRAIVELSGVASVERTTVLHVMKSAP